MVLTKVVVQFDMEKQLYKTNAVENRFYIYRLPPIENDFCLKNN